MRIVVAYKWAPDPREASVTGDGAVDWGRARSAISEDDPVAIEAGRALADALGAEVVGLTVGGPQAASPTARKAVLARGLDRLVTVTTPDLAQLDSTQTAFQLCDALRAIGDVDLVLAGDASVDASARVVPAVLAGVLGWPCVLEARAIAPTASGLRVERDVPGGTQTLEVTPPAVIALTPDAATPRVPGMRDILAAGKRPVEALTPAVIAAPTARTVSSTRPESPSRRRDVSTEAPAEAARALVASLRAEGAL